MGKGKYSVWYLYTSVKQVVIFDYAVSDEEWEMEWMGRVE